MDQARASSARLPTSFGSRDVSAPSPASSARKEKASSVASFGSGLAQHARSVVDTLNCYSAGTSDRKHSRRGTSSTTPSVVSASSATRSADV